MPEWLETGINIFIGPMAVALWSSTETVAS